MSSLLKFEILFQENLGNEELARRNPRTSCSPGISNFLILLPFEK